MLKEEFRTHTSYSGQDRFLTFPVFVFFLSVVVSLSLSRLLESISFTEMLTFAHLSAFLYGLSVGAFGLMGRQYLERRYGRSNYLVAMPYLLPLSFRTTFLGIYLRDALFYVLLLLVPATGGLLFAAPITGFSYVSIGLFFAAVLLSFLIGLSLSFLASVLFIRSRATFLALTTTLAGIFVLHLMTGTPSLDTIILPLSLQMEMSPFAGDAIRAVMLGSAAVAEVVIMTFLAYSMVDIRMSSVSHSYEGKLPEYYERLPLFKGLNRILVSKELVDLKRSGTVSKMFFSFVLPLLFLSFTAWFVNNGLAIPVGFNTVFYAAMVGFVGTLMYSWLNNIDLSEYYSILPVSVPQLIRVRVVVFLLLTVGISAGFVVAIAFINGDTEFLWLAMIVMFLTSLYMVAVMAYLTGLKTNTFLFDTSILAKFSVMAFLPDVCLTVLSFSLSSDWTAAVAGIALVLTSMLITTLILLRGIDRKWMKESFT